MRLSAAVIVCTLLGPALTLSACGEDENSTAAGSGNTASTTRSEDTATSPITKSPRHSCRHELGPFVASLAALRDDLARGLSYDDYLARVRGTREVYAKVRPKRIPAACLVMSGGPAERAFNLYIGAANTWGGCLASVTCSTRSIEPQLQRKWALAEHPLAIAQRGLNLPRGS